MGYFKSKEQIIYQVFLLTLLALTWMNLFDQLTYESNAATMKEALASFLSLKLLLGILAFMEDLKFTIGFMGTGVALPIGKLLEPIKDFSDTASSVMMLSVLSLTLQKFFLAIMQSTVIKVIITINVMLLSLNHFVPVISKKIAVFSFKLLIVLWFLRFMIPTTEVIINQITVNVVQMQTAATKEKMEKLQANLSMLQTQMFESSAEETNRKSRISTLNNDLEVLNNKLVLEEEKSKVIQENSHGAKTYGVFGDKKLSPTEEIEYRKIESDKEVINTEIANLVEEIKLLEDKNPSFVDKFLFKVSSTQKTLNAQMSILVDEWVNTMMLFLLRTVLMPLLLLWLLVKMVDKLFKSSFAENMEGYVKKDLKEPNRQAPETVST